MTVFGFRKNMAHDAPKRKDITLLNKDDVLFFFPVGTTMADTVVVDSTDLMLLLLRRDALSKSMHRESRISRSTLADVGNSD